MKPDEYLTQWVLYGNPSDFRDKFVIREVHVYSETRIEHQPNALVFDTETAARDWGHENLDGAYLSRMAGDDPVIIGVWA